MKHLFVVMVLLLISIATSAESRVVAGKVERMKGAASIVRHGEAMELTVGQAVHVGDTLVTGRNARLLVRFTDDSELVLGAESEFDIREFDASGQTGGSGVLKFVRGFFKSVSGRLARRDNARFRVETDTAIIGVRGTTFWGGYLEPVKLEIALLDGVAITVSTRAGTVELTEVGQGTGVVSADEPPTPPKMWGAPKLRKASATVAFE